MKVLKKVVIVVGIITVLLLTVAFFAERAYKIERDIVINLPKEKVFFFVKRLKNQERYSKWVLMDPGMKKESRGHDGDIGFIYAWDGEIAGKGEQTIVRISEGKRIDLALHFIKPFESNASSFFITEALSPKETRVRWGMKGDSTYPFNLFNFLICDVLGDDLDLSLKNLKMILEK